jgi:cyclopropane fatty-acyl-phospholipid synthase-like methyltransferase
MASSDRARGSATVQGPSPEVYWERAGEASYAEAMFRSREVERYVNQRLWNAALEIAREIGIPEGGHVMDLGCGDGAFANQVLAEHYDRVDGFDRSEAAIRRARALAARPGIRFEARDLARLDVGALPRCDGAFLIGILHHVKPVAPRLLRDLQRVTHRVVTLEPNGSHVVRKLLERTASYRAAGEQSFRTRELEAVFEAAGYRKVVWRRLNLFPNFTPRAVFRLLRPLEPLVESTPGLRALCTVNLCGHAAAPAGEV